MEHYYLAEIQVYDTSEESGVMQIRSAEDLNGLYKVFTELVLEGEFEFIPVWTVENMTTTEIEDAN